MSNGQPLMPDYGVLPLFAGHVDEFMRFHVDNPHVYQALVEKARAWQAAGHAHGSINMFFEAVRYDQGITTTGEGWKLNNNHRAHYARLIMEREPDLAGFFETRKLTSS